MFNIIEKIQDKFLKKDKIICYAPFVQVFISPNGSVYTCPECTLRNSDMVNLGNLKESSFKQIWNSSYSKQFRKKAKLGENTNCFIPACANKTNFYMHILHDFHKNNNGQKVQELPKIVVFGEDLKGYTNCNSSDYVQEIDMSLKEKYFEILKDAQQVVFSHNSDPFINKHTSEFIKEIAEKFKGLKFNFVSNGIEFNKENSDKLGITDRLGKALIFVNAATKETYDANVHNGDFEVLKQNLNWLKSMKQDNKLSDLFLVFLIDENNFKEMIQFVEFAKEFDARALFWLKFDKKFCYRYSLPEDCIMKPTNKNYAEFVKILNENNFNNEHASLAHALLMLVDRD